MATHILTINQLVETFRSFTVAHKQLRDFGYGSTSEIGTSREMKFPYMWVTHRTPSQFQIQNKVQSPTYNFTFLIVDQVNNQENYQNTNGADSNNTQEIISDCNQIMQDFITFVVDEMKTYGVSLSEASINSDVIFDETADAVAGVIFDMPIKVKHVNCDLPMSGITVFPNNGTDSSSTSSSANYFTTSGTLVGTSIVFDRNDLLDAYQVELSGLTSGITFSGDYLPLSGGTVSGDTFFNQTLSASTLFVTNETWTVELMDAQTASFYAPYSMQINSISNVLNAPSISIQDDGVAYTLGNPIAIGSKILVSANTASVITLNSSK